MERQCLEKFNSFHLLTVRKTQFGLTSEIWIVQNTSKSPMWHKRCYWLLALTVKLTFLPHNP